MRYFFKKILLTAKRNANIVLLDLLEEFMLPIHYENAKLVGRVWRTDKEGPSIVLLRNGHLIDVTKQFRTMSDLIDADISSRFDQIEGEDIGKLEEFIHSHEDMRNNSKKSCLLAPCDLQALKACGVTFAQSMIERVIDEKTSGNSKRAEEIRNRIGDLIGGSLSNIKAGSTQAENVKQELIKEGLWSQYLEVGIGPDAEVFTKAQPMSAVGCEAEIGINKISNWNNPEPEIVLAIGSDGAIRGATLGNDVNLRDVEGRSALLLGKAKDNNASCSIGPFIRLFDADFSIKDIETANVSLKVTGKDNFVMEGVSNMSQISRKPEDLVQQTLNRSHQYPDGVMLFLGTMFAPTKDRAETGSGFTHKVGDIVEISTPKLGKLKNIVNYSDKVSEWQFGIRSLLRNLAARQLI